jgi:hypothetical protein
LAYKTAKKNIDKGVSCGKIKNCHFIRTDIRTDFLLEMDPDITGFPNSRALRLSGMTVELVRDDREKFPT